MKSIYVDAVEKANCALDIRRRIVGVRFLFSQEEFDLAGSKKNVGANDLLQNDRQGNKRGGHEDRFAAARVLGIVELDDWYTSGHYYGNCGVYENFPTGKEVTDHMSILCAGAGRRGLKEDELAIGITLTKFIGMIDDLYKTITPVESSSRKKWIQENFNRIGNFEVSIMPDTNYTDAMHGYDTAHFIGDRSSGPTWC